MNSLPQSRPMDNGAPAGYKGPRGAILRELKRTRRLTAVELAAKLATSLNAIRHHLRELESESLVEYERVRHGVGAPVFAYGLTPAGEALFPRRYEQTLLQVLESVAERDGRDSAVGLLEGQYRDLARRLAPELAEAPPARRLELVARALVEAGYMAEWEKTEDGGTLTEHNCAIRAVAERFPEVCAAEARFIGQMVGGEVERRTHMLEGCNSCGYIVRFSNDSD